MANWSFLTNHARVLLYIARGPDTRLRDIAAALDITERSAFGIVSDLTEGGYLAKEKIGRRNRYIVQHHRTLDESVTVSRPIGEIIALLVETWQHQDPTEAMQGQPGKPWPPSDGL